MPLDQLRRLFDHVAWADQQTLEGLRRGGADAPQALEWLAHVLGAEAEWLARLEGRRGTVPVWPALTLAECAQLADQNRAGYAALLGALDDAALEREVHYRNSNGQEFDSRVGDILLHVALHGAYHRGQVAAAVRAAGAEPSPTDYIAFVRGAPAATRAMP